MAQKRLETWFPEQRLRQDYLTFYSTKEVMRPHFISLEWFRKAGFKFAADFITQGLETFVSLSGMYYPELVKVFYTCLRVTDDGEIRSRVNGVEMIIDNAVWLAVTGLSNEGIAQIEDITGSYNKDLVYLDTRVNSREKMGKRMTVGGMKAEDRVLVYMITHILTPRATNHAQVTDDDLQLLHCIKSGMKVNWVSIIGEVMKKAKRSVTYKFPYAVLISKFMEHFEVNLLSEVTDSTVTDCEIGAKHLVKMGLRENSDGKWVMASELEDAPVSTSAPAPKRAEASAAATHAGSSAFEVAVMEKLDEIIRQQAALSAQMKGVEDRVASLEKKLTFVDLGMEDPTEPAHEASPTHEPDPVFTEPTFVPIPDPKPCI